MEKQTVGLDDLLKTNFEDGTLVEYKNGFGFSVEWGRAHIRKMKIDGKKLEIETDGEAHLYLSDINHIHRVIREGEVFYLDIPILFGYALAPKGVEIPKKPSYEGFIRRN